LWGRIRIENKMLSLDRRRTSKCSHSSKGKKYTKCQCPICVTKHARDYSSSRGSAASRGQIRLSCRRARLRAVSGRNWIRGSSGSGLPIGKVLIHHDPDVLKIETEVLVHQDIPQRHDLRPRHFWMALSQRLGYGPAGLPDQLQMMRLHPGCGGRDPRRSS